MAPRFSPLPRRQRGAYAQRSATSEEQSWAAKEQSIFFHSPYAGVTDLSICIETTYIFKWVKFPP
jgi:hypothetical protein